MSCSNSFRQSRVKHHETWVHAIEFGVCHYTSVPHPHPPPPPESVAKAVSARLLPPRFWLYPVRQRHPSPAFDLSAGWGRTAAWWWRECGYGEHRGTHCPRQVFHVFPNSLATLWKPTTEPSYFLGNSCQATDTPAPPRALAGRHLPAALIWHTALPWIPPPPHCTVFIISCSVFNLVYCWVSFFLFFFNFLAS